MPDTNHTHENHERDPSLAPIGNALEGRAEALRREPDAGFESRVLNASRVALQTGAALRLVEGDLAAPHAPARRRSFATMYRLAAGLALLATTGAIVLMTTRSAPPNAPGGAIVAGAPSPDLLDELDSWLAMGDSLFADARLVSLRQEVDAASTSERTPIDILDIEEWM